MNHEQLETVYDVLAEAIDEVGAGQAEVFLAKVALALAETIDSPEVVLAVIDECKAGFAR